MKVLLVSDAGSIHTRRWASSLKDAGVDVVLFSITPVEDDFYGRKDIRTYVFDLFRYKKKKKIPGLGSLASHVCAVRELKKVLREECPDILHAHYATSYGLIAALSGYRPFILSVWGSDVYEFPKQSVLNGLAVKFMMKKADRVLSTSRDMAAEASRYFFNDIGITPFGVDTELFVKDSGHVREAGCLVFGTVKTLSHKYGIDLLIKAFAAMRKMLEDDAAMKGISARLVIAGKGPDRDALVKLADDLGMAESVEFIGAVDHEMIPELYSGIDVAVFLSRSESFGVSAVEAMSCSVPVIASDAVGFREILDDGAGIIVPGEDVRAAAREMYRLAKDPGARESLAGKGRRRVEERYDWKTNVEMMMEEYENILRTRL